MIIDPQFLSHPVAGAATVIMPTGPMRPPARGVNESPVAYQARIAASGFVNSLFGGSQPTSYETITGTPAGPDLGLGNIALIAVGGAMLYFPKKGSLLKPVGGALMGFGALKAFGVL